MSVELLVELLIMLLFLVLKGFFVGSEIAMVNSDKLKLRHRAKQGDKGAELVIKLFKTPDVIWAPPWWVPMSPPSPFPPWGR